MLEKNSGPFGIVWLEVVVNARVREKQIDGKNI